MFHSASWRRGPWYALGMITGLRRSSATSSSGGNGNAETVHAQLKRCAAVFPPIPQVLLKLERELSNDWMNVARMSNLIRTDPALVGAVLKLSNSPYWRGARQITEIEDAFQRIGKDNLRSVATLLALQQGNLPSKGLMGASRNSFWRHSLLVAAGSVQIARSATTNREVLEQVWTAGLMHDLGALLAPLVYPDEWGAVPRKVADSKGSGQSASLVEIYRECIGVSHARLGGAFAEQVWNMDKTISVLIGSWPDPTGMDMPFLAWAVHRADEAAQAMGICWQPDSTRATIQEVLPPESGAGAACDPDFCRACLEKHLAVVDALLSD